MMKKKNDAHKNNWLRGTLKISYKYHITNEESGKKHNVHMSVKPSEKK